MAISYSVNTGAEYMLVGTKTTFGLPNVTTWRRAYMKFDLTGLGITLVKVVSVKLRLYISVVGGPGGAYILQSSKTAGTSWGTTLEATQADHNSTKDYDEEVLNISAPGWYEFEVNKAHLNYAGWTWFRVVLDEPAGGDTNIRITSQNSATNKPVLRIIHYE